MVNELETGELKIIPCEPDGNGECLICDCWVSDCAYQRYLNKDYSIETKEVLEKMFEGYEKTKHN